MSAVPDPTTAGLFAALLREPWNAGLALVLADRLEEIGHPKTDNLRTWAAAIGPATAHYFFTGACGRRLIRRMMRLTRQQLAGTFPDLLPILF